MASRHPDARVRAAGDKLRAALSKLPPATRKAIAEMARQRLKELDDPESEISKHVRGIAASAGRLAEVLRAMPNNASRARALARFVKGPENA